MDHTTEAKTLWGNTQAYREFEEKTAGQTQQELSATGDALMSIFAEIGAIQIFCK